MKPPLSQGFVQVYTGDGKGKTTAAIGLAVRAAGAGLRVFLAQFAKGQPTAELASLAKLAEQVTVRRYGRPTFVSTPPAPEDIALAQEGFAEARRALLSRAYDLVILDEINVATHLGLVDVADLLELIAARPSAVELVLTGRGADPLVLEKADLVTEMREIRHYSRNGVPARRGIEF